LAIWVQAAQAVLAISIPSSFTEAMRHRIRKNEPAIKPTTPAELEEGGRPLASPYVGYWPLGTAFVDGRHVEVVVSRLDLSSTNSFSPKFFDIKAELIQYI
jgi:hypothetical protein